MKKGIKGFTLIELMVVIVILGILAAVIAPRIPQFVNKAKEGRTKGNLGNLRSAINIYYSDNDGLYPGALSSLIANGKYLKAIPDAQTVTVSGVGHAHGPSNAVSYGSAGALADGVGWWYEDRQTQAAWGEVLVSCTGKDSGNVKEWSTY